MVQVYGCIWKKPLRETQKSRKIINFEKRRNGWDKKDI